MSTTSLDDDVKAKLASHGFRTTVNGGTRSEDGNMTTLRMLCSLALGMACFAPNFQETYLNWVILVH
jgi:hypothetical protein